jgi:hypothetical protein
MDGGKQTSNVSMMDFSRSGLSTCLWFHSHLCSIIRGSVMKKVGAFEAVEEAILSFDRINYLQ